MEIRAAEGGDDAKLFVLNLYDMYKKFCTRTGFKLEEMYRLPGRIGVSELRFKVVGEGVYDCLIKESGGHRVQRVPPTEKGSRRHTSTVTVAVLKETEFNEITVSNDDVSFAAFRAGGKGGQNQNKVSSAVRLTHKETGMAIECREERHQGMNKQKALKKIENRLNSEAQSKIKKVEDADRKEQVGCGMRGDKIRTYNYRENRVTNHINGNSVRRLREVVECGRIDLIQ